MYPFPCARCGACCVAKICPTGQQLGAFTLPCRFLTFDLTGTASCSLVDQGVILKEMIGVGCGCDMKGKAINVQTGVSVDWASLPQAEKIETVQYLKDKGRIMLRRN